MTAFHKRLVSIAKGLWLGIRKFPLEAALGVVYCILFVLAFWGKIPSAKGADALMWMLQWFFPHFVLLFTLHQSSKSRPWLIALCCLVWLLWIPLLWIDKDVNEWYIIVAWLLSFILLFVGDRRMDNPTFGRHILHVVLSMGYGLLIGGLLLLTLLALIGSVDFLFALSLQGMWYEFPVAFIVFIIIPLLCCHFVTEPDMGEKGKTLLRIAVDYILSPALVLYAAILYVYIAMILLHWQLPEGGVAYLVLCFLAVGMACYLLRLQIPEEHRHFEWFYKAFPVLALAPLVLLWIGTIRRVADYGVTTERFYLLLLDGLVTLFILMLLGKRSRSFQWMTLILAAAAILFTYIPGIRAKDFGIRNQQARLEKLLPQLQQDEQSVAKIDDIFYYLKKNMDPAAFEARYGQYASVIEERKQDSIIRQEEDVSEPPRWLVPKAPVDLGEYTEYIPSALYRITQDSREVIVFSKETGKELLHCPVADRLLCYNSELAGVFIQDLLVYKNDQYLAIFKEMSVTASGDDPFTVLGLSLFKKP